jgi:hypothetical protein
MRNGFLGSITAMLAGAGLALAQPAPPLRLPAADTAPPVANTTNQAPSQDGTTCPPAPGQPQQPGQPSQPAAQPGSANTSQPAQGSQAASNPCSSGQAGATTQQTQQTQQKGVKPEDLKDDHFGPCERVWGGADYLLWWAKNGPLPVPLVTTSPTASHGILTNPGTTVLIGNRSLDYDDASGGRAAVGTWIDERHVFGFELGGFVLEQKTVSFGAASDATGTPLLAQPIINAQTNLQDAVLIAAPGSFAGAVTVSSSSMLWGLDATFLRNLVDGPCWRADLTFGFQYLDLAEDINIDRTSVPLGGATISFPGLPPMTPVTMLTTADRFNTRNQFYGGTLGGCGEYRTSSGFFVGGQASVALGDNHEWVNVQGSSTVATPGGGSATTAGGILALQGANIGRKPTDYITIVPQISLQVGWQLTDYLRVHVGWEFLYISDVVRPGDQINLNANPKLLPTSPAFGSAPGLNEPMLRFRQHDYWADGLSVGISVNY